MIEGRPLRFIATVLVGWTALRLAIALPVSPPDPAAHPLPAFAARKSSPPTGIDWMFPAAEAPTRLSPAQPMARADGQRLQTFAMTMRKRSPDPAATGGWPAAVADDLLSAQMAFVQAPHAPRALTSFAPGAGLSAREAGLPGPPASATDRWSGAAWMIWRRDGGAFDRPMLAGSQTGVRIDYALAPGSALRPALYGRVGSALDAPAAAEVATGVAIRPRLPIPVSFALERRQAISRGGRNDLAMLVAGGINPTAIGHGLRIDGYGQAGIVGIEERDAFIDGRVTVERPVTGPTDGPTLAVGASVWGGAQPGTSRLDVGPQASLRLRLGGASVRLGAEWREQVAGNATPGSGPALSLGTDF